MSTVRVPETITLDWIVSLSDADLVTAESRLSNALGTLERRERNAWGARYELMRGPADLLRAWDRWTRVNRATRERGLRPLRAR